ncbi:MAG: tyrosine-type recombinase/integrase [Bacteroidales bacterium]|nr:tyrosine-type recombinase/integrase [Bacteroidales bacterium]
MDRIGEFIRYLEYEKRYSVHTVRAYRTDLEQFREFLSAIYGLEQPCEADPVMVRSWVVSLMEASLDARSVNRKLSSLKSFFRYLRKQGHSTESPLTRVTAPRTRKRLPEYVEQEQMDLLLDEVDFGQGLTGQRDRLIIEILYFTGIRLSELVNLKHSDIDLYRDHLKVLGKRNKERIIPFGKELRASLADYTRMKEKAGFFRGPGDYLLLTDKGKKVYQKLVYRVVNSYLSRVSTLKKKSPHVLRHTFATHMLNNGADLNAVKELLGHANLSATQIYTHTDIEKLRSVYRQAHPRA